MDEESSELEQPVNNSPIPSQQESPQEQPQGHQIAVSALINLLEARPMMFWGGLWVSLLLIMMVAVGSLVSPGFDGKTASEAVIKKPTTKTGQLTTGTQPSAQNSEQATAKAEQVASKPRLAVDPVAKEKNRIPLWLFGAIALSCTGGSVLISRRLHHSHKPRRTPHPQKPGTRTLAKSRKLAPPRTLKPLPMPPQSEAFYQPPTAPFQPVPTPVPAQRVSPNSPALPPFAASTSMAFTPALPERPFMPVATPQPMAPPIAAAKVRSQRRPQKQRTDANMAAIRPKKVSASIVPHDETHPLDWEASSLAESVDLRRRRSVSSWM